MGIGVDWGLVVIDKNLIPDGKDMERTLHVLQRNDIITMDSLVKGKEAVHAHLEKNKTMANFYISMKIPDKRREEWKKFAYAEEKRDKYLQYGSDRINPLQIDRERETRYYSPRDDFSMHVYEEPRREAYENVCTNVRFAVLMALVERSEAWGLRNFVEMFNEKESALIHQLCCLFPQRPIYARLFYH
nr:hypothetical protein [Candidatus Sigynarchaeota archaeon]